MNGNCDFCPRPARLATAVCVHEHRVGVWVCAEKHEDFLRWGEIGCRVCECDVPSWSRHFCVLAEQCRICGSPSTSHDGAAHDAYVADRPVQ